MISTFDSFPDFVPLALGNCPKYSSKLRFSLTMNTMCWILALPAGASAGLPPPHATIPNTGKIAQDARAAFTEVTLLTGTRIWKKKIPRHRNPNDFLGPWRFSWALTLLAALHNGLREIQLKTWSRTHKGTDLLE